MAITVSMWSGKSGEIKRFLASFFRKEIKTEEEISRWIYVYNKPLEAIDIISALMDNIEKYNISMFIQIDRGDLHPINENNHNDIIKSIFQLFHSKYII
ncbi:MAG: hypothetical protein Q8942_11805 [Bacillota bacterium]|nr:hypothetical protein [Bacillota bacterium]